MYTHIMSNSTTILSILYEQKITYCMHACMHAFPSVLLLYKMHFFNYALNGERER